jgi:hypothetical protein
MIGKITFATALVASGIAFAQQTQQQTPTNPGSVQTQPTNSLPPQCWDPHTNQARPVTAADAKEVRPAPPAAAPGGNAGRPPGIPQC